MEAVRFDARAAFESGTLDGLPADVTIELLQGALDTAHKESDADDGAIAKLRDSEQKLKDEVKDLKNKVKDLNQAVTSERAAKEEWQRYYAQRGISLTTAQNQLANANQALNTARQRYERERVAYDTLLMAVTDHNYYHQLHLQVRIPHATRG